MELRDELARLLDARCPEGDLEAREELARALVAEVRREVDRSWAARPAAPRLRARFGEQGAAYQQLLGRIERIAGTALPALIEGEAGSGKALAALTIHQAGSQRAGPFLHVRGADSPIDWLSAFAAARGGTLLVTRVGALTPTSQDGLFGALADADPGAPRLLATATRDLARDVAAGAFSPRLERRLCVLRLRLGPAVAALGHGGRPEPSLEEVERHTIAQRLERFDWQQQRTANSLGIDRKTLYRKIRSYGLARPQ